MAADAPPPVADAADAPRARRTGATLLALAAAVFLGAGLAGVDDPWEEGFRGANGGFYHGNAVRHWLELGLGYCRGGAVLGALPGDPPLVFYYPNHPPTYPLLLYPAARFAGLSERTLRLAALALAFPALFFVAAIVRRVAGPVAGGGAALAFAAAPLGFYYGPMVNVDGAVASATTAAVYVAVRRAARPTRANGVALVAACLAAALIDWGGLWTAPTAAAAGLAAGRGRRGAARDLLAGGAATALGVAAYFLHGGLLTQGGAAEFFRGFLATAQALRAAAPPAADVLAAAGRQATLCGGFLPLAALGLVRAFRGGSAPRRAAGVGLALLLPGFLHAAAHPKGFVVHEFWFYEGLPGVAALAGLALGPGAGRRPRAALAALAVVAGVVHGEILRREHAGPERRDRAATIAAALRPGDAAVTNEPFAAELFYLSEFVMPGVSTPEALAGLYAAWRAEPRAGRRFVFFTHRYRRRTPIAEFAATFGEPIPAGDYLVYATSR